MGESIIFMILLQVVLIALNAVFACAEIAIISMNDNKMNKMAAEGNKKAKRLVKLTEEPARFLSTIQIAITLSGFLGSAFAAENFSDVLVDALIGWGVPVPAEVLESVAVIVITLILSYFTLVFGELVPKQVAMRKAEPLALGLSGLISGIAAVFKPIVSFLTFSTNSMLRLMGIDPNEEAEEVSEEEIRMMVDAGSEKGTIDYEEKEFIQNIFEFDDLSAEEIMTHRTDVTMLDLEDSMEEWKNIIYGSRHTLYPVCDGSADEIVGVLNAKSYFRLENQDRENVMQNAVTSAYMVPDTVKADTLFRNMRKERHGMAVILDEYGGTRGIVTINDLVEQLVGDLGNNETVEEEGYIELLEDNTWKVQGSVTLEEVSEVIGIHIDSEENETLSGLIFHEYGSVPKDGTCIEVDLDKMNIQVLEIQDHQVETAIIQIKEEKTEESEEEIEKEESKE
ncbi:MAG: HlyC/CorC family transporter [Lachnospiraceae bacterium]|nr:HlyC/CorC family transporter [Lachnospiraceae bacterium]